MTYFITGTDTEIGKTVASAWVMLHKGTKYWKPIQSGLEDETDSQVIRRLTGCNEEDIFPSRYELKQPLSPHEAARRDGIEMDLEDFECPVTLDPLIIEGAGGLMVPLNDQDFMIDLIWHLNFPTILVCRSGLGTINHTLLSLEALRSRDLEVAGVIMVGEQSPHNRKAIEDYGDVTILGEIPVLDALNKESLSAIKPEPEFYEMWKGSLCPN